MNLRTPIRVSAFTVHNIACPFAQGTVWSPFIHCLRQDFTWSSRNLGTTEIHIPLAIDIKPPSRGFGGAGCSQKFSSPFRTSYIVLRRKRSYYTKITALNTELRCIPGTSPLRPQDGYAQTRRISPPSPPRASTSRYGRIRSHRKAIRRPGTS
jgi:hypothetical protein